MGYLLTGGVAAFQIAILVTIIGATYKGRGSLFATTAAWILFTLIGSIFTRGLMILQLFTIFIACGIGISVARNESSGNTGNRHVIAPAAAPTPEPTYSSWVWIIVALVVVAVFFHNKATDTPLSSPPPVMQAPQQVNIVPKQHTSYSEHRGNSRNTSTPKDLRHCLNLPTNTEIVRCANQGK